MSQNLREITDRIDLMVKFKASQKDMKLPIVVHVTFQIGFFIILRRVGLYLLVQCYSGTPWTEKLVYAEQENIFWSTDEDCGSGSPWIPGH